ncbi:unnamed protein product [Psylliodes chrysocephalus]|uniref:Uncharacterized protein n=1 Tax=Psylliodes chrysocephalus TaxID=3402493 RepID=A0A9P0D8R0_9CUCU|nr:unnamed protein product [Psylliodes chrysocephala]
MKIFVSKLMKKWKVCKSTPARFTNKICLMARLNSNISATPTAEEVRNYQKRGRPKKSFDESFVRSKLRKIEPLMSSTSKETLCKAPEMSLFKSGERTSAQVMKLAKKISPRPEKKTNEIHNSSSLSSMVGSLMEDIEIRNEQRHNE